MQMAKKCADDLELEGDVRRAMPARGERASHRAEEGTQGAVETELMR